MRPKWCKADRETLVRLYPDLSTGALAILLRRSERAIYAQANAMGLKKSAEYLASSAACRLRRGGEIGKASRFKPGHQTWNAGKKGYQPGGRAADTQFRPGGKPHNWLPVGSERVNSDGYLQRKVTDTGYPSRDWVGLHILLWRAHHGLIPAGHCVVFRDRNRSNITLENLELITRQENLSRNSIHRYPEELKDAIRSVASLKRAIKKRVSP